MRKCFVLSPCGTSCLMNVARLVRPGLTRLVVRHANAKAPDTVPADDRQQLQYLISEVRKALENATLEEAAKLSAELNGIVKRFPDGLGSRSRDHHLILCTDTWLGHSAGAALGDWLRRQGLGIDVRRQRDLQTQDLQAFQLALSELVTWCEENISAWRQNDYHVIFNLTGGFKSVHGFLQTLAIFYADESIYVFETAKDLLRIPRLPLRFEPESWVRENLATFRRLALHLPVVPEQAASLPETLLMTVDSQVILSAWGEMVWQRAKSQLYREDLLPSPSDRIRYGSGFLRDTRNLASDRFYNLNVRIDQLAHYLESNRTAHLHSLDFKQLKANPCPPSTHEIDAWADRDARRVFLHWDGDTVILDRLAHGVH